MGGEVLDHPDVADASGKRTLPARGHLEHFAELAARQTVAHRPDRRVVALDMSDGSDGARTSERGEHASAGRRIGRQRLLDERRHRRLGEPDGDLAVLLRGSGDDAGVEPGVRGAGRAIVCHGSPAARPTGVMTWIDEADDVDVVPGQSGREGASGPSHRGRRRRRAAVASFALPGRERLDHTADVGIGQVRADRYRQHLTRRSIGLRKFDCRGVGIEAVNGNRVVRARLDAGRPQVGLQAVAIPRTNGVLVIRVTRPLVARPASRRRETGVVRRGVPSPRCRALGEGGSWTRPIAAWMSVSRRLNPTILCSYWAAIP